MQTILIRISFLLLTFGAFGQNFQVISETENNLVLKHTTNLLPFAYDQINGEPYIDFSKTHQVVLQQESAPQLPVFSTTIELPNEGSPFVMVTYSDAYVDIENVKVAPSKGNLKRNVNPIEVPYAFGEVYQWNNFYPENLIAQHEPFIFRTVRGLNIQIMPYLYNPVTQTLRVYEDIEITILFNKEHQGMNEIEMSWNDNVSQSIRSHMFVNRQDFRYTVKDEEGEMLIITHPDFETEMLPFMHWKNQKGIKTAMVTTNDAGSSSANIKSFIADYFAENPNTLYLVLVGDHNEIPAHSYGNSWGEQLWSDSYYGQLLGSDFYPELFVGRISAENVMHVRTQVQRTLEYEKAPSTGDWMEKAVGVGSNEGEGYGNMGLADWNHLRQIRTKLMDFGYTSVHEFYEGSQGGADAPGNPTVQMLQNAYNDGVGLWNYTGHGWEDGMSTCNYTGADANNAVNYGMYPVVISVACNNGTFTNGTCVGEDFLRANSGGLKGAVGFAGSTILMSWAPPMQTQWEMTNILTEQNSSNLKRTVGGLFYNGQISMLQNYPGGAGHEVMQTWAYFGDPSLLFRHKQTLPLSMSHVNQVPNAASSITVASSTEDARIAISQNNVLLGYGIISGGIVTINFDALISDDPLLVTATKQNHLATQQAVQVGNGPLSIYDDELTFQVYPNPASSQIIFVTTISQGITFELVSTTGQILDQKIISDAQWMYSIDHLEQGMYFARITHENGVQVVPIQVIR